MNEAHETGLYEEKIQAYQKTQACFQNDILSSDSDRPRAVQSYHLLRNLISAKSAT